MAARSGERDEVDVYFVPRSRRRSHVRGLRGEVGALEVMGELVFSHPEEHRLLEDGHIDYGKAAAMLGEASPEEVSKKNGAG